jgi:hypothetical protein
MSHCNADMAHTLHDPPTVCGACNSVFGARFSLTRAGAARGRYGYTALEWAAARGMAVGVEALLKHNANPGGSLDVAMKNGNLGIARTLLPHVDWLSAISQASDGSASDDEGPPSVWRRPSIVSDASFRTSRTIPQRVSRTVFRWLVAQQRNKVHTQDLIKLVADECADEGETAMLLGTAVGDLALFRGPEHTLLLCMPTAHTVPSPHPHPTPLTRTRMQ